MTLNFRFEQSFADIVSIVPEAPESTPSGGEIVRDESGAAESLLAVSQADSCNSSNAGISYLNVRRTPV